MVQHTVVRSSTLFRFRYPNLMLSLLQYISIAIHIAIFVCFQIAIYAYAVLRTFTFTRPSSTSLRLAGVLFIYWLQWQLKRSDSGSCYHLWLVWWYIMFRAVKVSLNGGLNRTSGHSKVSPSPDVPSIEVTNTKIM